MSEQTYAERIQIPRLEDYVKKGDFSTAYGMEWGNPSAHPQLKPVISRYIHPLLTTATDAVEIGSGGGRWSQYIWDRVPWKVWLVDATHASEIAICGHFREQVPKSVRFVVSPDGEMDEIPKKSVDVVFSFDTFVHFDESLVRAYIESIGRVLKPRGILILHYGHDYGNRKHFWRYYTEKQMGGWLRSQHLFPFGMPYEMKTGAGSRVITAIRR